MQNDRNWHGPPHPDHTIADFAVNIARIAGFIPSKRQPMPGTRKLWEGCVTLSPFVEHRRAMRDSASAESTVCH